MMADWLIIISAVVVLWALWLFMGYVLDLFQKAAQLREDAKATKGKGSSS